MGYRRLVLCLLMVCLPVPLLHGWTQVPQGGLPGRPPATQPMTAEQLANAREALKEATELARRSPDPSVMVELVSCLMRLAPGQVQESVEGIYAQLRTTAQSAPDLQAYQRWTSSAQALLSGYAGLNPARVAEMVRQWPEPPASLGESARTWYAQSITRFNGMIAPSIAGAAPKQAMGMAMPPTDSGMEYARNGMLVMKLNQSGSKGEALKLIDQMFESFAGRDPNPQVVRAYGSFLNKVALVDPDRYRRGLSLLRPALSKPGNPGSGGVLTVGDQSVTLTWAEAAVVDLCRNTVGSPALAVEALDLIPGLKAKVEAVGFITQVINGRPKAAYNFSYSLDGRSGGGGGVPVRQDPAADLYASVRGQSKTNPDLARQKLAEAAPTPDRMNVLTSLAARARVEDPELATMALDLAVQLVKQITPVRNRAVPLQNLLRSYRTIKGKINAELLQEGFSLLNQLNAAEEIRKPTMVRMGSATTMVRSVGSSAVEVEATLLAELAIADFAQAIRFVQKIPEDQRLVVLVRMVQGLAQSY